MTRAASRKAGQNLLRAYLRLGRVDIVCPSDVCCVARKYLTSSAWYPLMLHSQTLAGADCMVSPLRPLKLWPEGCQDTCEGDVRMHMP